MFVFLSILPACSAGLGILCKLRLLLIQTRNSAWLLYFLRDVCVVCAGRQGWISRPLKTYLRGLLWKPVILRNHQVEHHLITVFHLNWHFWPALLEFFLQAIQLCQSLQVIQLCQSLKVIQLCQSHAVCGMLCHGRLYEKLLQSRCVLFSYLI